MVAVLEAKMDSGNLGTVWSQKAGTCSRSFVTCEDEEMMSENLDEHGKRSRVSGIRKRIWFKVVALIPE